MPASKVAPVPAASGDVVAENERLREEVAALKAELKAALAASKAELAASKAEVAQLKAKLAEQSSAETGAKEAAPPQPPLPKPIEPSPPPPPGQKASSKAAPPDYSPLIKKGLVVPDETKGPYDLSSYHKNIQGAGRGFCEDFAGFEKWMNSNVEKLKEYDSLEAVDWDHPNAPDPDFALVYPVPPGASP